MVDLQTTCQYVSSARPDGGAHRQPVQASEALAEELL